MVAESISHFKDALIVLGTAGIAIPLLKRVGISNILGFMLVGVLLGPQVLGRLTADWPSLASLALVDQAAIAPLAELGVVFLLFLIGLELSPERLLLMKRLVFGLGISQVLATLVAVMLGAQALGLELQPALVVGMALSLSSTAIVVQMFTQEKRLGSQAAPASPFCCCRIWRSFPCSCSWASWDSPAVAISRRASGLPSSRPSRPSR